MALVVADRVQQTATANTTVSFTLSGSVAGFQSFTVVGDTNTTYYTATDASGNWEVGLGTYSTTGPTLTRTTILSSSNSNAAVTFSGTVNVFVTYPASKAVFSPTGTLAQNTQVFTFGSAQTYTAPTNTQWVKVTVVGGGGNGAGTTSQRGSGGGSSGVAIKWLAMTAGQTLTYSVSASSATTSTVSSGTLTITTITANAGFNGSSTAYAASATSGGAGGSASGGDININGVSGGTSYGSSTAVATQVSGVGGNCPGFGSGGTNTAAAISGGGNGIGYGSGGGGSIGNVSYGNGAGGIIIFEAY